MEQLYVQDSNGDYEFQEPATDADIVKLAISIIQGDLEHRDAFTSPDMTKDFLTLKLKGYEHEVFACMFLDSRHRLISFVEMFRGTIDTTQVHAREVIKEALKHNASAVIFSHNHPSGLAEPSQEDIKLTTHLKKVLANVDVRVLDHVVIGDDSVSFAERGLI